MSAVPAPAEALTARRSLVGRGAAAATLIALVAVALLYAVTYAVVAYGQTRGLAAAVGADLAGLADIQATSGARELIARIGDRQGMTASDGRRAHYALRSGGRMTAGDQRRWPALYAATSEQGYVTLDGGVPAYAQATTLAPGLELMVAREYAPERATMVQLALAFLGAGLLIALQVFALAWWRMRALARRLNAISGAYHRADPAAVAALIGESRADEVGEVARRSGHALARMRRLLDGQRHMSDHVAHELRTPLLHLEGRLRGLLKAGDAAKTAEVVALASDDIRAITTMLDSLLDIAATEASRGDPTGLAPFDLSHLANDLAELYRGSMEEAQIELIAAIAPDVTMIGEPMQLGRMLANLLDNAVKYVPAGGTVRFELTPGPVIVVADDGPGVPAALTSEIFGRFRRGQNAAGKSGHGLGLALARAIAERHGLSLTLAPTTRGCRFVVAREEDDHDA